MLDASSEFWLLAPEAILALAGLFLLVVGAWGGGLSHRAAAGWALLGLAAAAALVVVIDAQAPAGRAILGGAYALDGFAWGWKLLILTASALVVLLSMEPVERAGKRAGEYYALLVLAACGMLVMASGRDLLTLWVGLELLSLASYILAGYFREQRLAVEAALKYFVLGALSSAILLYGISLVYGIAGTVRLAELSARWPGLAADNPLGALGWLLLLAGLFFKIAAVPFHVWTPDVYVGVPTPVTAFLAVASKTASVALLARVVRGFGVPSADWQIVVAAVAVLTMIWGNLAALTQESVKRLLAYSAIAHSGYALLGILVASERGLVALWFYAFTYLFVTAGAFAVTIVLERGEYVALQCSDFSGLASRAPGLAAAMLVFLIALTGIPPTGGFVGKFYLFAAAVEGGWAWVAAVGVVMSAVSLYTYFRIVVYMYQQPGAEGSVRVRVPPTQALVIACCLAVTLLAGLWPGGFLGWAARATLP